MSVANKLHPDRFPAMSGKMAAIVGYILGESWTEPDISALSVTSDGFVTTEAEFLGEAADLDRNPQPPRRGRSERRGAGRVRAAVPGARGRLAAGALRTGSGDGPPRAA
jgi:hypothetical protein